MKKNRVKALPLIVILMMATAAGMAYTTSKLKPLFPDSLNAVPFSAGQSGIVGVSGHLVQDKTLQGSDGIVNLFLTIRAGDGLAANTVADRHIDMVIALDRSGSMHGKKLADAKLAISSLLASLSAGDRMALITYSDRVQNLSGLLNITETNRRYLEFIVSNISAGGGTNLGAGLQAGMRALLAVGRNRNPGKVILISDGLANQGMTHPRQLGDMAAMAIEQEFSISTVGVGTEFNEQLMTLIADRGTGNYYYLENPAAFTEVFQKEFYDMQATVATGVAVKIPLNDGISLENAAGYPIHVQNGHAVFYPGDLRSAQTRKLFLTMKIPTAEERRFQIGQIQVSYLQRGQRCQTVLAQRFEIACVRDKDEVYASIDKTAWTKKVLQEDFNRLQQEVAVDVRTGKKAGALDRIQRYYQQQQEVNAAVRSAEISVNLDKDLNELRAVVEETFLGAPAEISQKQKSNAKTLQFRGYRARRLP